MTGGPSSALVCYESAAGIATLELARPEAGNAISLDLAAAFGEATSRLATDVDQGAVKVAVVRAQGPRFCVGGDLQDFAAAADPSAHVAAVAAHMHSAIGRLTALRIPVVSAVHGVVAGGGIGLALSADIVLASQTASFHAGYVGAGLSPDCGTSWLLNAALGPARTMDLLLTNGSIDANAAREGGVVSRVVEPEELAATVDGVTSALLAASLDAVAATKGIVRAAAARSLISHLSDEAESIATLAGSSESRRLIAAFAERKKSAAGRSPLRTGA